MNFENYIQLKQSAIPVKSAMAVINLASEGATIPFMARYRKEVTGNLDEVQIKTVLDAKESFDTILKRQQFIMGEIDKQEKLTPKLKEQILTCFEENKLEDLYLPYKQKRKTKATIAKEAGLEPLALWILEQGAINNRSCDLNTKAKEFINKDKKITNESLAIQGAQNIIIETVSENTELRQVVRDKVWKQAALKTAKAKEAKDHSKFEPYFDYKESVSSLLKPESSHRYLALRRGWMEKELSLSFADSDDTKNYEEDLLSLYQSSYCKAPISDDITEAIHTACKLALKAHVLSSIQTEVHKQLKDVADNAAIEVFSNNVKQLLVAPPFGSKNVLGIDPGQRTGCKLAVVNAEGKYVVHTVMHLMNDSQKTEAAKTILTLIDKCNIEAIAIGNGTAGRETETFVKQVLKLKKLNTSVIMVSESGASVYSASDVAREEFPDLDLTVRGAISIARRLQDPLAELVKVDPKSIGVGQYQHDVNQNELKKKLDFVIDTCVNSVGVNLNTASYNLLSHVSGIGPALAKAIVTRRQKKGLFKNRSELLSVSRFSDKIFEQAAGFLRIPNATNPLDNTGVHPERYELLENFCKQLGKTTKDIIGSGVSFLEKNKEFKDTVGSFTFKDIIEELKKPGRDPRESFEVFSFREDIHEITDLESGMICPGIVTNVTNFGAFVDIGVHQDGLVHISQMADHFVKDPKEVVNPGDKVKVKVIEINLNKKQIALSLRMSDAPVKKQFEQRPQNNFINQSRQFTDNKFSNNPFACLKK